MSVVLVAGILIGYFLILILISFITSKGRNEQTFFNANKQSPWYVVAYGMIGASLSGITFISVPGLVGDSQFSYFQVVLGYQLGYLFIATVLMPVYYKYNLISIYSYLNDRFGNFSHKTGSLFFILSRVIGAAFRLFLVASVLQLALFDSLNLPFSITVLVTILLILIYTFRSGIKTIVYTDTLQTTMMLVAVIITVFSIAQKLNIENWQIFSTVANSQYSKIFFFNFKGENGFLKQFFGGAFIAIVMTGLDQDMMQKNLTCKNLKEAQKNMLWFSIGLIPVNLIFLSLGALLYIFAFEAGMAIPERPDMLYPVIALNHLTTGAGIVFLLGIIAAAYSSADSALTSLTTAFCIDFLGHDKNRNKNIKRTYVHIGFSVILFFVIMLFRYLNNDSIINNLFKAAGYTYGPLLGLFMFGLYTKRKIKDRVVPLIAFLSPVLAYIINFYSEEILWGYKFNFEILILNGFITFLGLFFISSRGNPSFPVQNNEV